MLQQSRSAIGQFVSVRQDHWRVLDVVRHDGCESWRLEGVRPSNRGERPTLLVPFDRPRPLPARDLRGRAVGARRGLLALRALAAVSTSVGQLRAAAAATIEILDYQLEPVLACLQGASRLLLADEVGLGKTVQAALVLAELSSRGEAGRVLVLTPAALAAQWAEELSQRFQLEPTIVERSTLARLASWSSDEEGPWARLPLAIASIDFVKQPEVLRGMGGVRWDLLVVDEAHACVQAPYRAAALGWLASRARRLVLLTATPHPGDEAAFQALCHVGRLAGDPPIAMFRRTRAGLGGPPTRRVRVVRVRIGEAEARMHRALLSYARRVWHRGGASSPEPAPARLAMTVLCKRAASGPGALLVSLRRRLELLEAPSPTAVQLSLPLAEEAGHEDEAPGDVLGAPGLEDQEEEQRELRHLIEMAREASAHDAKSRALLRLLIRARQPAVVFTEYRDTLEGLAASLAPLGAAATLHGGLDGAARRAALARFASGGARLLLATDAASLGLNLQATCRLVVNHDLPWSPMRLEQRIGRLDRIGQRRMVHAIHLAARGTFEEEVLARLALRVEKVRSSIGLGASPLGTADEGRVAGTIIGGDAEPVAQAASRWHEAGSRAAFVKPDLGAEARAEAGRLRFVRALTAPAPGRPAPDITSILDSCERGAPWRFVLRADRSALAPGMYALYRVRVIDGRGALLHDEVVPLFLPLPLIGRGPASRDVSWRSMAPAFGTIAGTLGATVLQKVAAQLQPAIRAQRTREFQMAALEGRAPVPVQAGLFDRRAEKAAADADARRRAARFEMSARLRSLDAACRPVLASPPQPLLLFLVARGRRPRWS
ncbi:MAG TPA: DEAD/DEAH box helicase [Vicinamibacterales bacterium]|nr:DEAD/DEAH box helicase [Vicinamibacterales bacterium]